MSKPDAWMPLYIGDYLADTMHLTGAEHGAYLLLLMHAWRNGPLPDNDRALAAIARTDAKDWKEIGPTIRAFFTVTPEGLTQPRLERERIAAGENAERRADAARRAAEARWSADARGSTPRTPRRNASRSSNGNAKSTADSNAGSNASGNAQRMRDALPGECPPPSPEEESSSLRSERGEAAPVAGPVLAAPDARTALFREGLSRLKRLTGKPDQSARSLMGGMLRDLGDDAAGLGLILAEAEAQRPADPMAWIKRAVASRAQGYAPARRPAESRSRRAWMFEEPPVSEPEPRFVPNEDFRH